MQDNPRSITLVRTFDSPIEKVWAAWTTPEGWVEWYGKPWDVPKDSAEMDVKVGGKWKSTTIAEGNTINFTGQYQGVDEPNKLVMTIADPSNPANPQFETVTVSFKKLDDNKTEMHFTQSGNLPPEEYAGPLKKGWIGFFDALEEYLKN